MNASPETETGQSQTAGDSLSIGARLRAAREARKLELDKVAAELKLDVSVVRALENDDRQHLPAAIFVQGYLRSYARLVGLPEQELVRDYTAGQGTLPPLTVRRIRPRRARLRLPSGALLRNLVLVLLLAIMLWLAWPFAAQLLEMRQGGGDGAEPGHLELPPPDQ
jgi:cytoskeleton protein RodZ